MLFVPLPLFTCFALLFVLAGFVQARDMMLTPHRLVAALLACYAVQTALIALRWGYGLAEAGRAAALLAPVLPVLAYLAYRSMTHRLRAARLWPVLVIPVIWIALFVLVEAADALIVVTYLGFGGALLWMASRGADQFTLSPFDSAQDVVRAGAVIGGLLIASGITDVIVIIDFVRTSGSNVPQIVTVVHTIVGLAIGLAAGAMRSVHSEAQVANPRSPKAATTAADDPISTTEDAEILARIEALFRDQALYKDEDLSLRRLARRLGLSDRRVSNAINRATGKSVSQFVNEWRIAAACALLADTDETILAVSLAVGYASKSNFNRTFQQVTGQTPSAFRAKRASLGG